MLPQPPYLTLDYIYCSGPKGEDVAFLYFWFRQRPQLILGQVGHMYIKSAQTERQLHCNFICTLHPRHIWLESKETVGHSLCVSLTLDTIHSSVCSQLCNTRVLNWIDWHLKCYTTSLKSFLSFRSQYWLNGNDWPLLGCLDWLWM